MIKSRIGFILLAGVAALACAGSAWAQAPGPTPPTIGKSFNGSVIPLNGISTLLLLVTNTGAVPLTSVSFTDTLPAGVVVAAVPVTTNNCVGGTITAVAGTGTISVLAQPIPIGGSCLTSVNVTGTTVGLKTNSVTASDAIAGAGNTAMATLLVLANPLLTKTFGAATIDINGITTLSFTLTNSNAGTPVTGLTFTDTLPAGLALAAANGLPNGTCGPVGVAANTISLTGVALPGGASCTFFVNVTGVTAGVQPNLTSTVVSTNAGTGAAAAATITVAPVAASLGPIYQLRYFANLQTADSFINATNAGTFSGLDPNGRICANFYVFDPREELVSCCSCLITPNGLVSLSARNDLISNTLTGAPLTSGITVKVLASLPTPVGGTVCNASSPTLGTLVRGLKVWGVTPHANTGLVPAPPAASAFQLGETEFAQSELSLDELAKLTGFCRFIQVGASGFGQCRSCPTVGAQGAQER